MCCTLLMRFPQCGHTSNYGVVPCRAYFERDPKTHCNPLAPDHTGTVDDWNCDLCRNPGRNQAEVEMLIDVHFYRTNFSPYDDVPQS